MEPQSYQISSIEPGVLATSQTIDPETQPRLRVLLDARKIGDGGIGVYTASLASGIVATGKIELTLLVRNPQALRGLGFASQVNTIVDDAKSYSLDEMFKLPRRIDWSSYDLYHVPHYTLPYRVPVPTVITLHDLIHVFHPEKPYYPLVARPLIRSAVRRASRVISVSKSTFDDLGRIMRIDAAGAKKFSVVPNAIDPGLHELKISDEFLRERFHVQGRYLLAVVSMLKPHKGIPDLLQAFEHLRQRIDTVPGISAFSDLKLILVGKATEEMLQAPALLELAGRVRGVHLLGCVTRHELAALFRGAEALVVPSRAEGFCLPVLEAHSVGTPVISRPIPAVKELLERGDVIASDFSIGALSSALENFLLQASSKPRSLYDLRRFDARTVGAEVVKVYASACEARR